MESSPLGRYCIDATEKRKLVSILMFIITGVCNGLLYFEKQIKVHIFVGFGEKNVSWHRRCADVSGGLRGAPSALSYLLVNVPMKLKEERKMQPARAISEHRRTMPQHGLGVAHYGPFPSKNTTCVFDVIISKQIGYSYYSDCTFTGKERDEETGYGYFGARYMDHELMAMWLSVDPMADKYPVVSPYAYCAWNPVKLVDPDGRDFETIVDHEKKTITIRAQFYLTAGSEKQKEALQKAINEWNSCSFEVSFPGAEKGSDNVYRVCFDINNVNGEGPSNYVSFLSDENYNTLLSGFEGSGGVSD